MTLQRASAESAYRDYDRLWYLAHFFVFSWSLRAGAPKSTYTLKSPFEGILGYIRDTLGFDWGLGAEMLRRTIRAWWDLFWPYWEPEFGCFGVCDQSLLQGPQYLLNSGPRFPICL